MSTVIPRAAVSVVVRSCSSSPTTYVLVQRGKEPNKGMWSLPGGKIESGEGTLAAAQRELHEETQLAPQEWYEGPFQCTDSIHRNKGAVTFHYVIAQCFCTVAEEQPLVPSDDAADAKWFNLEEMQLAYDQGKMTPGVVQVVKRAEKMYEKGFLPTNTGSPYSR